MQLFKKRLTIQQIAQRRQFQEATVWEHLAKLIQHNQLSLWRVLQKDIINKILPHIKTPNDKLKDIKERVPDKTITYNQINCVLAYVKAKNKSKNVCFHVNWYKKVHCRRKCYFQPNQRRQCSQKFADFVKQNPTLTLPRKEFLNLFNNHMTICVLPEREKKAYTSWNQFLSNKKKKCS